MFNPTEREKELALTHCLEVLGVAINGAQGDGDDKRKTTGVIIIDFKEDGDYQTYMGGCLNRGLTLGALVDTLIAWREESVGRQTAELFNALMASANIPDDELN